MKSLSVKYRPQTFDDVIGQDVIIKILKKQIVLKEYTNCYLFCGYSGIGKTTIARIFANEINNHIGSPIEIDGASNNGVDNVRNIINSARERAVDAEYKIFIIDEAHQITTAGWNAFLKCIEEPPKYTLFMFCTTDPQKIPATILNRVMRFNLLRIDKDTILDRLNYICKEENIVDKENVCEYISKISNGSLRTAISYLETISFISKELTIKNMTSALGIIEYDFMFKLTNTIVSQDKESLLKYINELKDNGKNITKFIEIYVGFLLDLSKYIIFEDVSVSNIPKTFEEDIKYVTNVFGKKEEDIKFFNNIAESLLDLKSKIKDEFSLYNGLELILLKATI